MTALLMGAALLAACGGREPGQNQATAVVEQLYRVRIEGRMTGAPSEAELAKMAPYLSTELQTLLRSAAKLRDEEARAHPDEKPPFVEGDLFTSLFEGPTSAAVQSYFTTGGTYAVIVEFTDGRANPPIEWTDSVNLKEEDGRWVVFDVIYQGSWDFANKGSLAASLKATLR